MRIAQVAPLFESVPPRLYGGTERVVSYLTEELVRQGHEVTLFASGDSETTARLVAGLPAGALAGPGLPRDAAAPRPARRAGRPRGPSIRRDPFPPRLRPLPDRRAAPLPDRHDAPRPAAPARRASRSSRHSRTSRWSRSPTTSGGRSRGELAGDGLPRACPATLHTFRERPGRYLAFLGRVSPEKGLDKAVEIARRAGMPLRVAAKIYPEERPYYEGVDRAAVPGVALGRVRRRGRRRDQGRVPRQRPGPALPDRLGRSRSAW